MANSGKPELDGRGSTLPLPGGRGQSHRPAFASLIACQTFIGVSGVCSVLMPRSPSASLTPLAIQGGPPIAPDSPQPLAPSGLVRHGAGSSSGTSIGGISSAPRRQETLELAGSQRPSGV